MPLSKRRTLLAYAIGPLPTPVFFTLAFAVEKPQLGWNFGLGLA
jgi:hypothetical protein